MLGALCCRHEPAGAACAGGVAERRVLGQQNPDGVPQQGPTPGGLGQSFERLAGGAEGVCGKTPPGGTCLECWWHSRLVIHPFRCR